MLERCLQGVCSLRIPPIWLLPHVLAHGQPSLFRAPGSRYHLSPIITSTTRASNVDNLSRHSEQSPEQGAVLAVKIKSLQVRRNFCNLTGQVGEAHLPTDLCAYSYPPNGPGIRLESVCGS